MLRGGSASRGPAGRRHAAASLALAMGLGVMPLPAQAGAVPLPLANLKPSNDTFTPEMAADRRMPIQEQGRQMVGAGELTAATILFDGAAAVDGDPVLFLDAADAYLQIAEQDRDIASAETAKLRAYTADDILYFHLDDASDPDFRLVTDSEISGLLARSAATVARADELIAEITAEQENVATPEAAPPKQKGDGKVMRIAGLGLVGLGVVGLGVGAAGLAIGRINQNKVEDPTVYGSEFDEFDAKGRRGNVIAGVGLAVGGVALAAGITLFVLGRKRGEASASRPSTESPSGDPPPPPDDPSLAIVPTGRGFALVGRF